MNYQQVFKKHSSFKTRLFLNFIVLLFISSITSLTVLRISNRLDLSRAAQQEITTLQLMLLELLNEDQNFISENHLDADYYRNGFSLHNYTRKKLIQKFNSGLDSLQFHSKFKAEEQVHLNKARNLIADYNTIFKEFTRKQLERGFKDYGLEGEMRSYANELQKKTDAIDLAKILELRRCEKNFLLRGEYQYVKDFNTLSESYASQLQNSKSDLSLNALGILRKYQSAFNAIVALESEIGFFGSDGIKQELNFYSDWATYSLSELNEAMNQETMSRKSAASSLTIVILVLGSALSLILIYFLATSISRPLELITNKMRAFSVDHIEKMSLSDFKSEDVSKEMVVMVRAYNNMLSHIQQQLDLISDQNNELEEKNANLSDLNSELDRFAYSVSHDLRSPIASILGLINLVKVENPQLIEVAYLHYIEECVDKLDKFIQNLLIYSKNAQEQVNLDKTNLVSLIESFEKTHFTNRIQNLEIHVKSDNQPILSDSFRLEIILQNLLSNSIRYRDLNKAKQIISITQKKTGRVTCITIHDNGIGILKNDIDKVFDLFYKSKLSEDGTGLGLFIVKKTLERIGGRIHLTSEIEIGTTVTLLIPDLDGSSQGHLDLMEGNYLSQFA